MKFDLYDIKSRAFPSFLSIMPILIFGHFYLYTKIPNFLDSIFRMKILGHVSASIVFTYLFMHVCRFVSKKFYQDKYFKDELHMPSTNYLMWSNDKYSHGYKQQIHEKIKTDFGIVLSTQKEETNNELEARKKIVEAIGQIRIRVKDGYLLLQHNIEYGFIRNLIGGSTVALILCLFNILSFCTYGKNSTALVLSISLFVLYSIPVFFSKMLISYYGNNYAKRLIEEYMST